MKLQNSQNRRSSDRQLSTFYTDSQMQGKNPSVCTCVGREYWFDNQSFPNQRGREKKKKGKENMKVLKVPRNSAVAQHLNKAL